jgi:hypothetical protein
MRRSLEETIKSWDKNKCPLLAWGEGWEPWKQGCSVPRPLELKEYTKTRQAHAYNITYIHYIFDNIYQGLSILLIERYLICIHCSLVICTSYGQVIYTSLLRVARLILPPLGSTTNREGIVERSATQLGSTTIRSRCRMRNRIRRTVHMSRASLQQITDPALHNPMTSRIHRRGSHTHAYLPQPPPMLDTDGLRKEY